MQGTTCRSPLRKKFRMPDIFQYLFIGLIVTLVFGVGWISITDPLRIYRFYLQWTLHAWSTSRTPSVLRMKLMLTDPNKFKAENAPLLKHQMLIGIAAIGMGVITLLVVASEILSAYLDAP
jgi:hypothetical protein